MLLFVALLALADWLSGAGDNVWLRNARYWIYPLQTFMCGALLFWFRDCYEIRRPRSIAFTLLIASTVFVLWISPQQFFGLPARTIGFNPESIFGNQAPVYWSSILFRFLRLVAVVPLIEEIFWRSFLLRFVIDEHFERVPFGKFTWLSFGIVTLAFTFSHSRPDWPAALIAGVLYNLVAYRTRSLASCVLAHATTNLLLGIWIMQTRQWGFW